eukprot:g20158.t1
MAAKISAGAKEMGRQMARPLFSAAQSGAAVVPGNAAAPSRSTKSKTEHRQESRSSVSPWILTIKRRAACHDKKRSAGNGRRQRGPNQQSR